MKAFVTYTGLRLLLLAVCYAVVAGLWLLVLGQGGVLLVPLVIAMIASSLLSLRLLQPQREAFARSVQDRADRATARFEEIRAKEDVD